ncbi:dTDP-4-dehydrorhamnose reductase [Pseudomonas fluorescens HK44]|uniref:dTDP-4-dehydrorhamnose reductase n=1 Tax=Pseudomonas fluorescens HK44 TaxID=1042209 RepID=A0A010TEA4_PSEFL|nr:dTDP-4-dehydrorhamnose reductase [Pseudomonas fluorescens]EXF95552.1 dTDP-4-dehydrorhamnose reductase [Pseudomonas fluorescens HK44]
MKVLLLGKNGQVGWELQRSLSTIGEVVAPDRLSVDGVCGDLANSETLRETIKRVAPDIIVNAAAYTAVDKAESDKDLALQVNAAAVQVIAEEAFKLGSWVVHYSTDYVFDGSGASAWRENDVVSPINHYGLTKLLGEQALISSGCKCLIFRTSWVYGARGSNFAKTMLRLASSRPELNVIADQIGAPTGADLIADVTTVALRHALQNPSVAGVYHLAAAGFTSWYEYASLVIDYGRNNGQAVVAQSVKPISSAEYPTPARRPLNSRLNTEKLRETFSIHLPEWQSGVTRMLKEVLEK